MLLVGVCFMGLVRCMVSHVLTKKYMLEHNNTSTYYWNVRQTGKCQLKVKVALKEDFIGVSSSFY